jgi:hypothetical protein
MMKQKIYVLGVVTTLIVLTGIIFKVNHLAGAGILLTTGLATLVLIFIPLALRNHYKAEESSRSLLLYIVIWLTCFVVFTAMAFKIQHWPYSGILMFIALPFPYVVFLPVFLRVTSKSKSYNIYNVVFVLSLLAFNSVFTAMLSLNVTKERIEDSYNLSRNYNKVVRVLQQLPERDPQTPVDLKIDEVLKIVNEYQDLILKSEGISSEAWSENPGNLRRPDATGVAAQALLNAGDLPAGTRLEAGLKSLITLMENTHGYEGLAKAAPLIFNFTKPMLNNPGWTDVTFKNDNLSWVIIYLDALKVNLYSVRASVPVEN